MNLSERIRLLSRRYSPELPEPQIVCSLVYDKITNSELIGATETKVCRGEP